MDGANATTTLLPARICMCKDAPTGDPMPIEFDSSARVPSIDFQCPNVMNDQLVSIPVVKLTSMTHNASSGQAEFNASGRNRNF